MANVKSLTINGIDILDFCHPIGSIYMSNNSKDPSDIFGGTWERIKGKVLVGLDENDADFNSSDKTGGSKSIALDSHHLPVRTLISIQNMTGASKYTSGWLWNSAVTVANGSFIASTMYDLSQVGIVGNQVAVPLLQPYQTVYMWKRIS